ncbi:hypothetical protein [Acetobacterium woodii]|uniref:Uncharacterized protein n=1 Tax=Acetobacterium woodii (strain ATCC 29683 / DSM 1030 / JCM 2381 / KCTC 1655 / WB1) TaxID=931626 RepID=H6LJ74_ACEWD|nr:hypothetical protein [Acetobacterium woodii]AFA48637.1 hypothetical protein Awo_c18580 [Acetobacterium woodii DSM 1030]
MKKTINKQERIKNEIKANELPDYLAKINSKSLKEVIELIVLITGIFGTVYFIYGFVYVEKYKNDCANFYEIPREYFSADVNYYFLYLVLIILFAITIITPKYIKNYLKKKDTSKITDRIIMSFFIGLFGISLGQLIILNFEVILMHYQYLYFVNRFCEIINSNMNSILIIMIGFSIVFQIGITYDEELNRTSNKIVRSIVLGMLLLVMIIIPVIYVWGTAIRVSSTIEDKTLYETTRLNEKNMAILTTVSNQFLVSEYNVDEKERVIHIYTDQYMFVNRENLVITLKKFNLPIKIN